MSRLRPERVRIGPCRLIWDGQDLGATKGGVTLIYQPDVYLMTVDQRGNTPYDAPRRGERLVVRTQLAESTWRVLQAAMPGGRLHEHEGGAKRLSFGGLVRRLGESAKELVLHPLANADDDPSDDVWIWRAIARGNVSKAFTLEGERVIPVEFQALLDLSKPPGQQLFAIGLAFEWVVDVYRGGELLLTDEYVEILDLRNHETTTHRIVMPVPETPIEPGDRIDMVADTILFLGMVEQRQAQRSFDVVAAKDYGTHLDVEVVRM